ncbi:hypothetical protein BD779DRAFT_603632 [Infundibulicybe gibba]|nr:hypothetical protein BD779DRAFT_603632 [Infundibulicybe gibba]
MTESLPVDSATKTSELFRAPDADIVYRSSDGVRFRIHSKNLESTTGILRPGKLDLQEEVELTEEAKILELLFQFIYPQRQPDISSLSFMTLALLAEAAEKYEVFPAMGLCKIHMAMIKDHTVHILSFAIKHGYKDLVDEAAPLTIGKPLSEVASALPSHIILPWVRGSILC